MENETKVTLKQIRNLRLEEIEQVNGGEISTTKFEKKEKFLLAGTNIDLTESQADSSTQIFQGRGNFCHRHRSDHSVSSK